MTKNKLIYSPEKLQKEFFKSNGELSVQRKYHLKETKINYFKNLWFEYTKDLDISLNECNSFFFNPYQKGIYREQINALYLLGSNKWHSFPLVFNKIKEIMSLSYYTKNQTFWEKLNKTNYNSSSKSKISAVGRVIENYHLLQRLSGHNPFGYKLYQVNATIDLKKEDRDGFPDGLIYYKLNTHNVDNEILPVRDYSNFNYNNIKENLIVNKKFFGIILAKNKIMRLGSLYSYSEYSQIFPDSPVINLFLKKDRLVVK